jgi:hypothetical protein
MVDLGWAGVEAGTGDGRRICGRGSDQGNFGLPGGFRQSDVANETNQPFSIVREILREQHTSSKLVGSLYIKCTIVSLPFSF